MDNSIEHEGDEFFDDENVTNRNDVEIYKNIQHEKKLEMIAGAREKLQKDWLHLDNPNLWDGEID